MGKSGGVAQRILIEGTPDERRMIREERRVDIRNKVDTFLEALRAENLEWRKQAMIRSMVRDIHDGKVEMDVLRAIIEKQPIFANRLRNALDPRTAK